MALSTHDWKIVDWNVKPQYKQISFTNRKKNYLTSSHYNFIFDWCNLLSFSSLFVKSNEKSIIIFHCTLTSWSLQQKVFPIQAKISSCFLVPLSVWFCLQNKAFGIPWISTFSWSKCSFNNKKQTKINQTHLLVQNKPNAFISISTWFILRFNVLVKNFSFIMGTILWKC